MNDLRPGTVLYTRMISQTPLTPATMKTASQFSQDGDFVVILMGGHPNGKPALTPKQIFELGCEIGIVTLEDVRDALGQTQFDHLNKFLRDKYEREA